MIYCPSQNGVAARFNTTFIENIRAILQDVGPKKRSMMNPL